MKKPTLFAISLFAAACACANIFETNETQRANLKVAATWAEETAKAAARPVPLYPTPPLFVRRALVADKAAGAEARKKLIG